MMKFIKNLFFTKNEDAFWQWFKVNEERIFAFESDREIIFNEIAKRLHLINPSLTFEFGQVKDGKREFVISADGVKSAFPAVEELHAKAPSLDRWTFIKFRQRRPPLDIEFGGKEIKAKYVHYSMANDGQKVGLVLFIPGYNENEKMTYMQIGYLFLDGALGEFAVETQVGFIEFESHDSPNFPQSLPLETLPENFDDYFASQAS